MINFIQIIIALYICFSICYSMVSLMDWDAIDNPKIAVIIGYICIVFSPILTPILIIIDLSIWIKEKYRY